MAVGEAGWILDGERNGTTAPRAHVDGWATVPHPGDERGVVEEARTATSARPRAARRAAA